MYDKSFRVPLDSEYSDMTSLFNGLPCRPSVCRWNSLPISNGRTRSKLWLRINSLEANGDAIRIKVTDRLPLLSSHLKWINSPISAGKLLSLLLDTSNVRRFTSRPTSGGKRTSLLSLRYMCVRCSNCQRLGLRFRTLPVISMPCHCGCRPAAISSGDK